MPMILVVDDEGNTSGGALRGLCHARVFPFSPCSISADQTIERGDL